MLHTLHCFAILPFIDHLHYCETMPRLETGPIFQPHAIFEVGQGKSEWTGKAVPWPEEGQSLEDYLDASGEQYCT